MKIYDNQTAPNPRRVRIFLAEKRITGVGIAASEELRLLVAASAVTLTLGWRLGL